MQTAGSEDRIYNFFSRSFHQGKVKGHSADQQ